MESIVLDQHSKKTDEIEGGNLKDFLNKKLTGKVSALPIRMRKLIHMTNTVLKQPPLVLMDQKGLKLPNIDFPDMLPKMAKLLPNSTLIVSMSTYEDIMSLDKAVVIDRGEILEIGEIPELIKDQNSRLSEMIKELDYDDYENLYEEVTGEKLHMSFEKYDKKEGDDDPSIMQDDEDTIYEQSQPEILEDVQLLIQDEPPQDPVEAPQNPIEIPQNPIEIPSKAKEAEIASKDIEIQNRIAKEREEMILKESIAKREAEMADLFKNSLTDIKSNQALEYSKLTLRSKLAHHKLSSKPTTPLNLSLIPEMISRRSNMRSLIASPSQQDNHNQYSPVHQNPREKFNNNQNIPKTNEKENSIIPSSKGNLDYSKSKERFNMDLSD